jgi:hypothetical protein
MTGLWLQGEEERTGDHPFGGAESMKLNPPKKSTFWAAVVLAAVGVVVYVVHLILTYMSHMTIGYLRPFAFLLVLVAFILICLGLTRKNL